MACGGVLTDLVTLCLMNGRKGQEALAELPGVTSDRACKAQPLLQQVQRLQKDKKISLALPQRRTPG